MNRQSRRHPAVATVAPPAPPPEPEKLAIHVSTSDRGRQVTISEFAARVLVHAADLVTTKGSAAKVQIGLAQAELEDALAALEPLNDQEPDPEPPLEG